MKFAISTALALILGTTAMADTAQIGTMTVTGTARGNRLGEIRLGGGPVHHTVFIRQIDVRDV